MLAGDGREGWCGVSRTNEQAADNVCKMADDLRLTEADRKFCGIVCTAIGESISKVLSAEIRSNSVEKKRSVYLVKCAVALYLKTMEEFVP